MSERVGSMVQRSAPWVVSMQLSWGDYVLGLRDLRAGERASWSELGGREFVRFVDGEPWLQAPSASDGSAWQRLEAGVRHSFALGELGVLVWGFRSSLDSPRPRARLLGRWLAVAAAVAVVTSPISVPGHSSTIPSLTGGGPTAERAALGGFHVEPPAYVVRLAFERRPQLLTRAGSTRCGEAEMGDPSAPSVDVRYGMAGARDNPDPHLSRERVGAPAERSFGAVPIATNRHAPRPGQSAAPSAPWGRDSAAGSDEQDAVAHLWGETLADGDGALGLGLASDLGGMAKGMELRAGGAAAGRRVVQAGLVVRGPRRVSEIGRALQPRFAGLRGCVEQAVEADRDARIALRLQIDAQGAVDLTSVEAPSTSDPALGRCLAEQLEGARLPGSSDGPTEVEYPLVALRDSTEPTAAAITAQRRFPPLPPCAAAQPCSAADSE